MGARLALLAWRRGWSPTALTLANVVVGIGTSTAVILVAGPVDRGQIPGWLVGITALTLWHLAYGLDCADGQLARVTGRTSAAGARLDVLADVAVHASLVAALAATASLQSIALPAWLVAVVAATWMVNVVTSVLQSSERAGSLLSSGALGVRLLKIVRDHSFVLTACAVSIGFLPAVTPLVMTFFACLNGTYLAASIVAAAGRSLRPGSDSAEDGR